MLFPELPETDTRAGIARLAASSATLESKRSVEYRELPSRRYITACGNPRLPFRWTLNPYRGCEFGCPYCYARYTHEFLELRGEQDFERKIFAKQFDRRAFAGELGRIPLADPIAIGTATDPYQPAERRFAVTRRMLEVLALDRGRTLSITTKSDLVTRDAELLLRIARANRLSINVTITTLHPDLARLLEPLAPRPELRLRAVSALSRQGLQVGVFASPVLPGLTDAPGALEELALAAAQAGAGYLAAHAVFLKPCAQAVFLPFLERHFPPLAARYRQRFRHHAYLRGEYPQRLAQRLQSARERAGLGCGPLDYQPEDWAGEAQRELPFVTLP